MNRSQLQQKAKRVRGHVCFGSKAEYRHGTVLCLLYPRKRTSQRLGAGGEFMSTHPSSLWHECDTNAT